MLQTISKHIQGWVAGVIVAIIAAAFVLFGLEYYLSRGSEQRTTVATVNGVKIDKQQLEGAFQAFQREYAPKGAELNEESTEQLRNLALQQLILNQVLLQTAKRAGFDVSLVQVENMVKGMKEFAVDNQFSPQRFQELLNNNGLNVQSFLQQLRASLLLEQLRAGFQSSAFALPQEVARAYAMLEQRRSFGYFILPNTVIMANIHPTDTQINAYYEKNKEKFRTSPQVKVAYLLLSPDELAKQIKIPAEEVQQFYQANTSQYSGKSFAQVQNEIEQRLIQQQLNQVLSAKSEQLADLTYTNPSSLDAAAKALDLPLKMSGWLNRQGIKNDPLFSDPKVLAAIFSDEVLKQNNNSQPIELKNGSFVVVRVSEQQPSQLQNLAAVRDQIAGQLRKDQAQKEAGLQAYEIQRALESGENPVQIAGQRHLAWQTKENLTRNAKDTPSPIVMAAFKLMPQSSSDKKSVTSVLLPNGDYAIIQLLGFRNADYAEVSLPRQQQLNRELANRWGQLDYQFFAKSAMDKAKIIVSTH